nr:MAG TPA: DNA N-6-adenine-methyltransferase [Caudoviricetes sp.]
MEQETQNRAQLWSGREARQPGFRKHLLHGEHHDGLCHAADPALDLRQSDGHRRVRPDHLVRQPDGQRRLDDHHRHAERLYLQRGRHGKQSGRYQYHARVRPQSLRYSDRRRGYHLGEAMDVTFEGKSSTGKNEWLTPPHILRRLGSFDLDPCAPVNRPWNTAAHHYTIEDDGLKQQWFGRVFCNPPYDTALIVQFIRRCVEHRNAIALTFARTDTRLFHELVFPNADSILFIKGRLSFYHVTGGQGGTAGAPSCLIAFDKENTAVLERCGIEGKLVKI